MDARSDETTLEAWAEHLGVHGKNWTGTAAEPASPSAALVSRRGTGAAEEDVEPETEGLTETQPEAAAAKPAGEASRRQTESRAATPEAGGGDAAGVSGDASAGSAGNRESGKGARGYVVLTIGLPGSGKTTWFKRRGVVPLSSDLLRTLLFDDITEQRWQGLVFSTLRSLLRARLIAKMPWNYVDATNLSPHERRQWIKMAKSFGYDVHAVFFDVPLEVCLERNRKRERTVSEDVMKKMAERLRAPDFKEGFSKITVVRVKGPEKAE